MTKLYVKNEFGEQYSTAETIQEISDATPAKTGVEALEAIATADATDLPEALVLVNELKAEYNALLAALKVVS
jgi:hypothetical protein